MVTSTQCLQTISIFIGSILYFIFLFEMNTIPQIVSFQLMLSFSTLIIGSIMSYGLREKDDHFLKAFGINVYLIGSGYECKNSFVYDATSISYSSCVLGWILMMGGFVLVYFKRGKPTESAKIQFFLGGPICAISAALIMLDIVLKTWTTTLSILTGTVDKALIGTSIGILYMLNGSLLYYIFNQQTTLG